MFVLNRYLVFIFLFLYEKVAVTTGEVVADSRLLDGTDTLGNETMIDISTRNHSVKKGSKKQGKRGTIRFFVVPRSVNFFLRCALYWFVPFRIFFLFKSLAKFQKRQ